MEYITNTLGNLVQQTAFLTDCIWYASGKYLPGYHASCRRFG